MRYEVVWCIVLQCNVGHVKFASPTVAHSILASQVNGSGEIQRSKTFYQGQFSERGAALLFIQ